MRHRHLNHERYTPAAIDDVVSHGRWVDWADLRRAAIVDPRLLETIARVCNARASDRFAMRHRFWLRYAKERGVPDTSRAS